MKNTHTGIIGKVNTEPSTQAFRRSRTGKVELTVLCLLHQDGRSVGCGDACAGKRPNHRIWDLYRKYAGFARGDVNEPSPFTGNGFTKVINGEIIPEYKCAGYIEIQDGAQLIEIDKDGTETLLAIYDADVGKFVPVD